MTDLPREALARPSQPGLVSLARCLTIPLVWQLAAGSWQLAAGTAPSSAVCGPSLLKPQPACDLAALSGL